MSDQDEVDRLAKEPDHRRVYAVSCRTPQCHGGIFALAMGEFPTVEDAIQAWNTRA